TNWRQSSALEKVHDSLNSKSVVSATPVKFRPTNTPDPGYVKGKAFSNNIRDLKDQGLLKEAGLTPSHIQSLQDLGTLLENSASVKPFGKFLKGGGALFEIGSAVVHPAAALAGLKAAAPAYIASRALGKIMTDPKFAAAAVKALQSSVGPAVAAQTVPSSTTSSMGGGQRDDT